MNALGSKVWAYVDVAQPIDWSHPLNRDLVSWWLNLPQGQWGGGKIWRDLNRARCNDGTLTNIAFPSTSTSGWGPTTRPGGFGEMRFDGTDDYCRIADSVPLRLVGNKTVAAMIKTTSPGSSYRDIIAKDQTFALSVKSGVLITYDWAGTGDKSSGVTISDGLWHHCAVSISAGVSSGSQLYVDGKPAGSSFTYLTQNGGSNTTVNIGDSTDANTDTPVAEHLNASLDDIRLYNRALSATEVLALYQQSLAGHPRTLNRIRRWLRVGPTNISYTPAFWTSGSMGISRGILTGGKM